MNAFELKLREHGCDKVCRRDVEILQINVGKLCNQTCTHCHVHAGPDRKESLNRETIDRIVDWLARTGILTVDITGGAPEMIPDFRYLVERIKALTPARHVMDRCNLTVLFEPGQESLPEFLARHEITVIASLPCYSKENVDRQRGDGVFEKSIAALRRLNAVGYGTRLDLNLVYNPLGPKLPPMESELEADYREILQRDFGIVFSRLLAFTNQPVGRFAEDLRHSGRWDEYLSLLANSFNPANVGNLMCRTTLSVGWRGEVYDCDFNQMLGWQLANGAPLFLWDVTPESLRDRVIRVGEHCLACTSGCGSSCLGALSGGNPQSAGDHKL
ncbi:MAG: arsenosugar biosynthesis radical SAM (seleno)protein ArsS [Verrucomicrobiia bacterium]